MIRFPRRLQLGFRPWYGLSLRQMGYLLFAAMFAGLAILTGPTRGVEFIARVVIGLVLIGVGVALAFFRWNGMTLEWWLVARVRFFLRPHWRVWTRGGGRRADGNADLNLEEPAAAPAPLPRVAHAPAHAAPLVAVIPQQALIVFADLALILAFLALTLYLRDGGWLDLRMWYLNLGR